MQLKDKTIGVITNIGQIGGLIRKGYYSHTCEGLDRDFVDSELEEKVRQLYIEYSVINTDVVDKMLDLWEDMVYEDEKYEIMPDESREDYYHELLSYFNDVVIPNVANLLLDLILISALEDE